MDGDRARVAGTARVDRTAFGVGQGEWAATDAIAAGVDIDFSFSATRPASSDGLPICAPSAAACRAGATRHSHHGDV
ncbi:MAG TPA: hypothetical protein VJM13_14030 [Sphingopyxis sp.]|nr:hypothetical protein [Sphingopyxis sp.]